jgi:hypothetical protein
MWKVARNQRAAQQIIGREGETATFLSRCLVSLKLRVGGFAPRQLNRWASSLFLRRLLLENLSFAPFLDSMLS